ncbi:hypothetical protein M8C21_014081, partial [Ambrosia artemisiifolia]
IEELLYIAVHSQLVQGTVLQQEDQVDICASIDEEVKKKIFYTLKGLSFQDSESVLVLFWAAKEFGDATVLTTTCQPSRRFGDNEELQDYHLACLDHKLYVCRNAKKAAAFGIAGWVYLYCTPQQTQNVHAYPEDQRPPCKDAIFTKKWGSFAVPVIDTNKCVGVLEVVIDTPRDYNDDILAVQRRLEHAGLQTSIQIDRTIRTYLYPKKMIRKSKSFDKTSYCRLVPLFGVSRARVAKILGVKPGTFTHLCRRVGIPVWPCIRKTTISDSSISEAKINQMIAEPRSSITPNADLITISDEGVPQVPLKQIMTSDPGALFSELDSPNSMHDERMINIDHINVDVNSIRDRDEGFFESSLEQTITLDSDALLPECVGPGFMANHAEMEFDNKYAPSMGYLDFMDDELERININHPNAYLNPIWDEGFLESSLEQTISQALLPEHCGSNFMANHGENEHQDNYAPSMESDVWFPELGGLDSIADLGKMEYPGNNALGMDYPESMNDEETNIIGHQKADLNSVRNEEFHGLPLEQSMTSESDDWIPKLADLDSIADLDKMECPGNNALGMDYPDSMNDEETIIIGHQKADLNSIRVKGLSDWSLEQTKTMDSDFMADLDGMESHDSLNDDTWIAEMIKEMQQELYRV